MTGCLLVGIVITQAVLTGVRERERLQTAVRVPVGARFLPCGNGKANISLRGDM